MLIFPVGDADIVAMLESKPKVVLMQSASVASPPLLSAIARIRKGGVEVKMLLGAKPDYEIVDSKIVVGSRPYDFHAGAELESLRASKVPVYIDPRFNELRATEIVPGARSHASYLVTNAGASLVCTGPWNAAGFRQMNICVRSDDRNRALALTSLHSGDFDFERPATERLRREQAARTSLVVCPDCESALRELLIASDEIFLRTAGLGDATSLIVILRSKATALKVLLPTAYRGQNPLVDELGKLGAQVRYVEADFDGLMLLGRNSTGGNTGLIGSMQLTQNSLGLSREVGVLLSGDDLRSPSQLWEREWLNGKP